MFCLRLHWISNSNILEYNFKELRMVVLVQQPRTLTKAVLLMIDIIVATTRYRILGGIMECCLFKKINNHNT